MKKSTKRRRNPRRFRNSICYLACQKRRDLICLGLSLISLLIVPRANAKVGAERFEFEPQGRTIGKGSDPQLGVRASGDLFLLRIKDRKLWLQISSDGGDSFDEGTRVNDAGEVSSHSENTPIMVVRSMHEFYVLWTAGEDSGEGHDKTTLRLARSMDWGKSFGKSIAVDPSGTASQSFYTMAVAPDGAIYVAWLDGRDRGQGKQGGSALYIAKSTNRGQSFDKSVRVALNVCPCCRPSVAFKDERTVHVGWRGVLSDDIRDVLTATSTDGGASFGLPIRVAEDNWQINGCPHAGPSLATLGDKLFVVWRTVSGDRSRLYIASSNDTGTHFSRKSEADTGLVDANHPRLAVLDGTLGLVFQARDGSQNAWGKLDIYFRQIDNSGALSPLQRLSHASGSATNPTLLFESPDHVFVAWTEGTDDGPRVVLARARRSGLNEAGSSPTTDSNKLTSPRRQTK